MGIFGKTNWNINDIEFNHMPNWDHYKSFLTDISPNTPISSVFFLSWNFRWTMADIQICEVLLHELAKFKYHSIEVATNHGSSNWLTSNGNLVSKARWHKKKLNMLPRALRCIVPKLDGMAKGVKFNFSCCYERFHLELIASVNLGMNN